VSSIELIREGILQGDWQKVCDGFAGISGIRLEPPAVTIIVGDDLVESIKATVEKTVREYIARKPIPEGVECAREVHEEKPPSTAHRETDYDKFKVQHGRQQNSKGRKSCRVMPFEPGMTNSWEDDGTIAADAILDSKRLSEKKKPEPRRPPVKMVAVTCCKCGKSEEVNPLFAPKSLDRGDQSSYVCNDCIKRSRR